MNQESFESIWDKSYVQGDQKPELKYQNRNPKPESQIGEEPVVREWPEFGPKTLKQGSKSRNRKVKSRFGNAEITLFCDRTLGVKGRYVVIRNWKVQARNWGGYNHDSGNF